AMRGFVDDVMKGLWPAKTFYSAQYWSVSWVDPDIGRLFLEALAAARTGDRPLAERLLYSNLWSKWGTMYKYRSRSDLSKKARDAYERSVDLSPTYPWGFYELANIELEAGEHEKALSQLQRAIQLCPSMLLFHNNAGVAQLGLQQSVEAETSFRKVLDLEATSFATIKGVSPRAGACMLRLLLLHALDKLPILLHCKAQCDLKLRS
ncbi:MAG: hypothetical protein SGPRY_010826, partial [Prymnesium sp.]